MINVRVVFAETGTGEDMQFDGIVAELTGQEIAALINSTVTEEGERIDFTVEAFVNQNNKKAAFILSSKDIYFGDVLWTGLVYTQFI